uniref:Uncharacterized protein n=1 Tax=Romanomermis culicivorax TaxID=13658 RepID=A0A915JBM3_ROMCU
MDYSFYVVAVQCYYESVDHEYMPAEISVVEF